MMGIKIIGTKTWKKMQADKEKMQADMDVVMGGTMIDYVISGVNETKIMDVFEHTAKKEEKK